MSTWKNQKRDERRQQKKKEWDAAQELLEAERRRRERLTIWERIEEADASRDVKELLHLMADHMGMK